VAADMLCVKARHPSNATAGKIRSDFMSPPILGELMKIVGVMTG
jgi:hypothetical protein